MKTHRTCSPSALLSCLLGASLAGLAVTPNAADEQLRQQWTASWLSAQPGRLPSHLILVEEDVHDTLSCGSSSWLTIGPCETDVR